MMSLCGKCSRKADHGRRDQGLSGPEARSGFHLPSHRRDFHEYCRKSLGGTEGRRNPLLEDGEEGRELNEKYPGGIEGQKALLEAEGHTVLQKGKKYFVKDYAQKLFEL